MGRAVIRSYPGSASRCVPSPPPPTGSVVLCPLGRIVPGSQCGPEARWAHPCENTCADIGPKPTELPLRWEGRGGVWLTPALTTEESKS